MKQLWLRIFFMGIFLVMMSAACQTQPNSADIAVVQMARDVEGTQPTTTFGPDDTFYILVDLQNAPEDTTVRAVWTAVQVEGAEPGTIIKATELETGSSMVQFELSNTQLWPEGRYRVDIFLNDDLEETSEFLVQ